MNDKNRQKKDEELINLHRNPTSAYLDLAKKVQLQFQ